MIVYKLKRADGTYVSGRYDLDRGPASRARNWKRKSDVANFLSKRKNGDDEFTVEEWSIIETPTKVTPGAHFLHEVELVRLAKKARQTQFHQEKEKQQRRRIFDELKKEFVN